MRLAPNDLAKVLGILEGMDRGASAPRFPDRIGRYLRQYKTGRDLVDQVLAGRGIERRTDGAISGRALLPIEIHPVTEPEVSVLGFPLGEVADSMAISEELGGLVNVIMWLKGGGANAAYNLLRENPGLRLSGDYRWSPPARVTPGESCLVVSAVRIAWQDARCLKAVADDLSRPPNALEYVLDFRMGPPGVKFFRSVCVTRDGDAWRVLPGLTESRRLEVEEVLAGARQKLRGVDLATLLAYREPWSKAWTIVDAAAIDANDAYAHALTWADFRRELDGSEIDGTIIRGLREALDVIGLRPGESARPNLTRCLLPVARDVVRRLRGLG